MDSAPLDIEDRAACERYLVATGHAQAGDVVEHKLLAGGVSCATVLVAFADGRRWVLKQALAKLRVKADWFSDPNRIHREALGMRVLGELAPPGSIPKLIFDDAAHHVIGMEAVPEPHENWKTMLLQGEVNPRLFSEFGSLLGTIHYESWRERSRLAQEFDDRSFFESLRLEPYYEYSAEREPQASSFIRNLLCETRVKRTSVVHGDFSPKNVLIHLDRLILLDHEVIHWGDPAFDVGFALTHILSKALHLQSVRRTLIGSAHLFVAEYLDTYCSSPVAGGAFDHDLVSRCVRHTLACLLARVVGRSPLEYLSQPERDRQRDIVLRMMHEVPMDLPELIERYMKEITAH